MDKHTGNVLARDDAKIGPHIFHGEWSSPSTGCLGGRTLVFHGGGDGVCYAFDAEPVPPAEGQHLGTLHTVWRFDVNAAAGREGKYRATAGPSEIIATPVFYKNRVYVSVGQDPTHGKGRGALACIDATQKGDITQNGKVWVFDELDRSLSTVAIANDLVYAADNSGRIFCLDADTGKTYWRQDTGQPICSSPLVADGKVYLGTDQGILWVFAADKELKVINQISLDSAIAATPAVADGVLYVATQRFLYAATATAPDAPNTAR
jgi:outer membrane protein assembly factor BamB